MKNRNPNMRKFACAVVLLQALLLALPESGAQALTKRNGVGSGPPDGNLPAPTSAVAPDFGVYVKVTCPDPLHIYIIEKVMEGIAQAVDAANKKANPNAPPVDARPAAAPACGSGLLAFGIWNEKPKDAAEATRRDKWLGQPPSVTIPANQNLAVFINTGDIISAVDTQWQRAPKTVNDQFAADPAGHIHLKTYGFQILNATHQFVTTVKGYDDASWPSVDFTYTDTDTLSMSGGSLTSTATPKLVTDDTALALATFLSNAASSPLTPVLTYEFGSACCSTPDAPNLVEPGSQLASQLPQKILLPGGLKLTFSYESLDMNDSGIFIRGSYAFATRSPSATIYVPEVLLPTSGAAFAKASPRLIPNDLRPPFSIAWTAIRGTFVGSNPGTQPLITLNIPLQPDTQSLSVKVSATVTDADGLKANASGMVQIQALSQEKDKVCDKKPWLTQCKP